MMGKLCLLCCQDVCPAVQALVQTQGWTDVQVVPVAAPDEHASLSWPDLHPRLGCDCSQLLVLDGACLRTLGEVPANWPPVKRIALPTGAGPGAESVALDLDGIRQLVTQSVTAWQLERTQQSAREQERSHARELADHKCALDFLGRLALLKDERETIIAIAELFQMLFAPQQFYYLRFEDNTMCCDEPLPPALQAQVRALDSDWAWTSSGTGFLLRIGKAGATRGVVVVDQFEFPQYRDHYLNLALSFAGMVALVIDNARTYRRILEAEQALRKSERSLKIAQAMAHLGHWELDVGSGDVRWSDETYRILGYQPEQRAPSIDAFLQVVHPEDREWVVQHISAASHGGGFDIEFRIVLPQGQLRVLRGMGEVIHLNDITPPQIIGAVCDITTSKRTELLGVVQDITEQKELQWKLEREARTDPLTGCTNRRHFLELAEHELARARRYAEGLSILMLDLDHFKNINDQYGHQAGDLVLQRLVQVCQATLRAEDVVGRLGGEEFAILMPESHCQEARAAAERVCLAVAGCDVSWSGNLPIHFTTSVGVATLQPQDQDVYSLIGRADKALYEAKSAGRNRVAQV